MKQTVIIAAFDVILLIRPFMWHFAILQRLQSVRNKIVVSKFRGLIT